MRRFVFVGSIAVIAVACSTGNEGSQLPSVVGGTAGVNSVNSTSTNSTSAGGQGNGPGGSTQASTNSTTQVGGSSQNGGASQSSDSAQGGIGPQIGGSTSQGGSTTQRSNIGGSNIGGSNIGGSNIGGSNRGGATQGGSSVGGASQGGGSARGGSNAGGNPTGGTRNAGGSTAIGGSATTGGTSTSDTLAQSQCDGKPGPSYADFFDNNKLASLKVTFDSAALGGANVSTWLDYFWGKWKHCGPFNWTPVQFAYESPDSKGNLSCSKVGMRLRGSMPRDTNQIQGFKLDMQALDTSAATHRRFADLNRINLLSIESDPSHLIQCLSYKAMRDFGIPAPQCNHLKVYVNGTYYGLLENVEQVNKGYARRHFGSNQGSLYAASPSMSDCPAPNNFADSAAKLAYSGDSFSTYTAQYQLLGGTTSANAEKDLIPMLKCGDATQTPDEATFKKCIAEWIDVNEWLKAIAAESLMPTMQSWIGYYRNYYLYFKADSTSPRGGRFVIWSWDLDNAWQRVTCYPSSCDPMTAVDGLYGPRSARAKLITRLTTSFKTDYCKALNDFANNILKPTLVDNMAKVIEPAMSGEPSVTTTAWQAEVTSIRNFINTHATSVKTQITTACQ